MSMITPATPTPSLTQRRSEFFTSRVMIIKFKLIFYYNNAKFKKNVTV